MKTIVRLFIHKCRFIKIPILVTSIEAHLHHC